MVLMLGGAARAMGPDCNPNAPGTVYPPTDCSALTSSNAIGLGGRLSVSGGGFQPATAVTVELHSTVVKLGTLTSDSSGSADGAVSIPDSIPVGTHDLDLTGVNPDGTERLLSATVQINALSQTGSSMSSGFGVLFWIVLGVVVLGLLGVLLLLVVRRGGGGQAG